MPNDKGTSRVNGNTEVVAMTIYTVTYTDWQLWTTAGSPVTHIS